MKPFIGTAAILLVVVPTATRTVQAQYRPPRIIIRPQPAPPPNPAGRRYVDMDYPSPEKRAANLAELLNLSDEQRDKVKDIFVAHDKQASELWADESLSTQARLKKLAEVRINAVKKVRELLTDEQKKKYDALNPADKPQEKPRLEPDPNAGGR